MWCCSRSSMPLLRQWQRRPNKLCSTELRTWNLPVSAGCSVRLSTLMCATACTSMCAMCANACVHDSDCTAEIYAQPMCVLPSFPHCKRRQIDPTSNLHIPPAPLGHRVPQTDTSTYLAENGVLRLLSKEHHVMPSSAFKLPLLPPWQSPPLQVQDYTPS